MRLRVVTCGRVLRTAAVLVLGRTAPTLITIRAPGIACAVPACGACITTLGATATPWETGGIIPCL